MKAKSQNPAPYNASNEDEDRIIAQAMAIIERRSRRGMAFTSAKTVGEYFIIQSRDLEHEVFSVAFLDSQNRLISIEELSRGTLNQAAVYPREIAKAALSANAASVIFHHNHPSGYAEPSGADELLTARLKTALELFDVRVLDHVITGGAEYYSFAEHGLI